MIEGIIWTIWLKAFPFLFFQGKLCLLTTLRKNRWTDFHEIFGRLRLMHWIYIRHLCFLAILWTHGWTDFHEILSIWTQRAIGYTGSHSQNKARWKFTLSECLLLEYGKLNGRHIRVFHIWMRKWSSINWLQTKHFAVSLNSQNQSFHVASYFI